jgi:hypothetical protein
MPKRGGFRPGAGRPKGSKNIRPTGWPVLSPEAAAQQSGLTPLAYLLSVMRDPTADPVRRDRAAQVAAAYVHAKPSSRAVEEDDDSDAEGVAEWKELLQ